jgi:hypothetical protein
MVAFPPSSASGSSLVARAAGATAGKPGSASQSSRSPRVYANCGCLPPAMDRQGQQRQQARVDVKTRGKTRFARFPDLCVGLAYASAPRSSNPPLRPAALGDRRARQCFAGAGVRWSGCGLACAPRAAMRPVGKARRPRILAYVREEQRRRTGCSAGRMPSPPVTGPLLRSRPLAEAAPAQANTDVIGGRRDRTPGDRRTSC